MHCLLVMVRSETRTCFDCCLWHNIKPVFSATPRPFPVLVRMNGLEITREVAASKNVQDAKRSIAQIESIVATRRTLAVISCPRSCVAQVESSTISMAVRSCKATTWRNRLGTSRTATNCTSELGISVNVESESGVRLRDLKVRL